MQAAYKYCIPKSKHFRSAVTGALKKGGRSSGNGGPKEGHRRGERRWPLITKKALPRYFCDKISGIPSF
jgi:hypothetical protein